MYAPLPPRYAYLADRADLPKVLAEMLRMHGLREAPGPSDNPIILDMAGELGLRDVYDHDAVPWCGLGLGVAVHRAGYTLPPSPLWALSWAEWGVATGVAALGDVIVFRRRGGGHVGLYVGEDDDAYHVLGCNQGDTCSIARFGRRAWATGDGFGVAAIRRSPWRLAQPPSVRPIRLDADGPVGAKVV